MYTVLCRIQHSRYALSVCTEYSVQSTCQTGTQHATPEILPSPRVRFPIGPAVGITPPFVSSFLKYEFTFTSSLLDWRLETGDWTALHRRRLVFEPLFTPVPTELCTEYSRPLLCRLCSLHVMHECQKNQCTLTGWYLTLLLPPICLQDMDYIQDRDGLDTPKILRGTPETHPCIINRGGEK